MIETFDIDEEVVSVIEKLAIQKKVSRSEMFSELLREALAARNINKSTKTKADKPVGGFRPFPSRGNVVTNEQIDRLRDQEGI